MVDNLLQQLADRKREVISGDLDGPLLEEQNAHFENLIKSLKEKVEKLTNYPEQEKREQYVKTVDETYADFKNALSPRKVTEKELANEKAECLKAKENDAEVVTCETVEEQKAENTETVEETEFNETVIPAPLNRGDFKKAKREK